MTVATIDLQKAKTMGFDELLAAASHLPPLDRLRLSDLLRDTVPPEEWPPLSDDWMQEIQHRSDEYDSGRMTAAPWSDVRSRARREAGLDG
jgi:putative addiction module component (TIGR02574 family)